MLVHESSMNSTSTNMNWCSWLRNQAFHQHSTVTQQWSTCVQRITPYPGGPSTPILCRWGTIFAGNLRACPSQTWQIQVCSIQAYGQVTIVNYLRRWVSYIYLYIYICINVPWLYMIILWHYMLLSYTKPIQAPWTPGQDEHGPIWAPHGPPSPILHALPLLSVVGPHVRQARISLLLISLGRWDLQMSAAHFFECLAKDHWDLASVESFFRFGTLLLMSALLPLSLKSISESYDHPNKTHDLR